MTLGAIILLALIQGLTEFFPVSSSGHLVLAQQLLGVQSPGLALEVALHLGTVVSVIVVFFSDIVGLWQALLSFITDPHGKKSGAQSTYRRLIGLLIVGSIPAGLLGLLFEDSFERLYGSPRLVGLSLILTGIILVISSRLRGHKTLNKVTMLDTLIIGVGQGLAITPGISRSGLTISTALFRGLDRDVATRVSFLLAIPAIVGAAMLNLPALVGGQLGYPFWWVAVGVVVSALSGIIAIRSLVKVLKEGRLYYFSYYVWILGLITLWYVR